MPASKSDKGSDIGTADTNVTSSIDAQGPLEETLVGMGEFDINKLKDSPKITGKYMWKPLKGGGSKP